MAVRVALKTFTTEKGPIQHIPGEINRYDVDLRVLATLSGDARGTRIVPPDPTSQVSDNWTRVIEGITSNGPSVTVMNRIIQIPTDPTDVILLMKIEMRNPAFNGERCMFTCNPTSAINLHLVKPNAEWEISGLPQNQVGNAQISATYDWSTGIPRAPSPYCVALIEYVLA